MINRLAVSEHFYSIQGEGPTSGKRAVFLRLRACNLLCGGKGTDFDKQLHDGATWRCDTIEVWRRGTIFTLDELLNLFSEQKYLTNFAQGAHLVVTGGEPFLQIQNVNNFIDLIQMAVPRGVHVEIETNGTIFSHDEGFFIGQQINCSPKLSNSGVAKPDRYCPDALFALANDARTIWKFVISQKADLEEIDRDFLGEFPISREKVWLMPAAQNQEELDILLPFCANAAKEYGFNLSNRFHISIWNQTTGV